MTINGSAKVRLCNHLNEGVAAFGAHENPDVELFLGHSPALRFRQSGPPFSSSTCGGGLC